MELTKTWNLKASWVLVSPITMSSLNSPSRQTHGFSFPFWSYPFLYFPNKSCSTHAKKRNTESGPVLKPTIVEEVYMDDDEDDVFLDDFDDEELMDDAEYIVGEYGADDAELYAGDGGGGGGTKLAGTWWDQKALAIAEEVTSSFDDLKIYAFKTLANSSIQVRIEKLSNKSGSPSLTDIEDFSSTYRARLDEAELAGSLPDNISLEVSSPGVERVVRIPQELDRFKDRPLYVKYVSEAAVTGSSTESDGVFRLISFDLETNCCTWVLADVRTNREKAGKGRPLSKKQREWRLNTSFDSLLLVRVYSDI